MLAAAGSGRRGAVPSDTPPVCVAAALGPPPVCRPSSAQPAPAWTSLPDFAGPRPLVCSPRPQTLHPSSAPSHSPSSPRPFLLGAQGRPRELVLGSLPLTWKGTGCFSLEFSPRADASLRLSSSRFWGAPLLWCVSLGSSLFLLASLNFYPSTLIPTLNFPRSCS